MAKYSSLTNLGELIPRPDMIDDTIHEDGTTIDIIQTILMADGFKSHMAAREMRELAAQLVGENDYHTLMNVWDFVHANIKYKADPRGHERIKSPSRLWYDREGDCKSFSLMIGAILRNYPSVGFSYRFVGYDRKLNDYTHVYVIAHLKNRPVIMDAVHTRFDEEVPYVLKKDYSMTHISHLHGIAPNYNRGAKPNREERFADAPRKAIRVPDIKNLYTLTEGQLSLKLLSQSLEIDKAYYGMSKDIAEAEALIYRALNSGSGSITGYVDTELGKQIAQYVQILSKRNYGALNFFNPAIGDPKSDRDDAIVQCRKKYPVAQEKNKFGVLVDKFGDPNYSKLYTCITEANQIYNILNSKQFVEGSHHMLYEFNNYNFRDPAVIAKTVDHKNAISAWGQVVGTSRDNVRLYAANGIKQTSAVSGTLKDISPEGNINIIKEAYLYKGTGQVPGIGEPISAAVVTIVLAVLALAAKGMDYLIDKQRLRASLVTGMGNPSFGPEWQDFDKDIKQAEQSNNYIIIGGALLATAALLIPSKKSKS